MIYLCIRWLYWLQDSVRMCPYWPSRFHSPGWQGIICIIYGILCACLSDCNSTTIHFSCTPYQCCYQGLRNTRTKTRNRVSRIKTKSELKHTAWLWTENSFLHIRDLNAQNVRLDPHAYAILIGLQGTAFRGSVGIDLKELGVTFQNVWNFEHGLTFKTDFHSKTSVCRHELQVNPQPPAVPTLFRGVRCRGCTQMNSFYLLLLLQQQ